MAVAERHNGRTPRQFAVGEDGRLYMNGLPFGSHGEFRKINLYEISNIHQFFLDILYGLNAHLLRRNFGLQEEEVCEWVRALHRGETPVVTDEKGKVKKFKSMEAFDAYVKYRIQRFQERNKRRA